MTDTSFVDNQTVIVASWAQDVNDKVYKTISSIASLKTKIKTGPTTWFVSGYYASGDGGGGMYYYDSTDTTSLDNGGTIIVANDGGRWKLDTVGITLSVKHFGAKGDNVTDDTAAIQATINSGVPKLHIPLGTYFVSAELLIQNRNGLHIYMDEGTTLRYTMTYVAGTAGIKILNSSNIKIENGNIRGQRVGWTGVVGDIATSPIDFGVYSTSGGPGAAGNNRFLNVSVNFCRVAGFCLGNNNPAVVDQTTDEHQLEQCSPSFCAIGIKVLQANTNMTRILGGWVTDFTQYGIYIGNNARGVTISNVLMYTFSSFGGAAHFFIAKENSGPVTIKDVVTELYWGYWLQVEAPSAGLSNKNLLTIENCNVTNNDTTVGQNVILYEGAGSVALRNCRFSGASSLRGGVGVGQLVFSPHNAAVGGTQWLITELNELYDGCTWNVQTTGNTGWERWLDVGSTLVPGASGTSPSNPPIIREQGKIQHELYRLIPVNPATWLTVQSVGSLGKTVFKATVNYTAFTAAALVQDIDVVSLPPKTIIKGCYVDVTTPFSGLAGTIQLSVGAGALGTQSILVNFDVKTAAVTKGLAALDLGVGLTSSAVQGGYLQSWTSAGRCYPYLQSGTGNLGNGTTTNLTGGQFDIYIITEVLP